MSETSENAAFRAEARRWISSNAPWHLLDAIMASPPGSLLLPEDKIAAQKSWQMKKYRAGYACLPWPRAYGGRDATPAQRLIWHEEEGAFARLHALFHNGQTMGAPTLMDFATEAQKLLFLPRIASGEDVWCQLFSEPAAGSDLAGIVTKAERHGADWLVNGQKVWTSGGQHADYGILIARSDPSVPKHKGLTAFVVDMRGPGIEARPIRQMNDQTGFAEVFFQDVILPDDCRLGEVGGGWTVALTMLAHERLAIGLEMPTGFQELFDFCRGFQIDGQRALENAEVIARLASFDGIASGLENFMAGMMGDLARGKPTGPEASLIKLAAGQLMQRIAFYAMDLQGVHGLQTGGDAPALGQFQGMALRAPATRIEGGSDQILRNIIAERVLGMPPDLRADKDIPFFMIMRGQ